MYVLPSPFIFNMAKYKLQRLFTKKDSGKKKNRKMNQPNPDTTPKSVNTPKVDTSTPSSITNNSSKPKFKEKEYPSIKKYLESLKSDIKTTWKSGVKGKAKILAVPTAVVAAGTVAGLSLKKKNPNIEYKKDYKY